MAERQEKCLLNHRKLGNTESTDSAATQLTVSRNEHEISHGFKAGGELQSVRDILSSLGA